jgi:hypothetical protein
MNEFAGRKWILFRGAVILVTASAAWMYPREMSNLDWVAAGIISAVGGIAVFAWLTVVRSQPYIEWSYPYDISTPFWPMKKYPLRYWNVAAMSMCAAGLGGGIEDLLAHRGFGAFSGTFLGVGVAMYLAVVGWMRSFGK